MKEKINMQLIKRTDPRNLNPNDCCFIFSHIGPAYFRIYHRGKKTFTDYLIRNGVTPFIKFVSDDVELKEYLKEDGAIEYEMDFPECSLRDGVPALNAGEVWESPKE